MVKAVIDKDILGWANDNEQKLLKSYESILKVGEDERLPQRSSDSKVGSFCKDNDCVLFTADSIAFTYFYEDDRIKNVKISKFDWYTKGDRSVYLVEIVE